MVAIGNKGLFKQLPHSLALVKDLQNQSNDNNKAKVPSTDLPVQSRFHFSNQRNLHACLQAHVTHFP